ncbi:hypothetical protein PHLCEN_2v13657 [Hermanssonia centrifuga]|uniref:MSP domain-containing protein n=1 Tax=Hermanssonia centrifuga TaxID=98765 RepID=A0A2R6NDV8_9APHY|nr:hypothetical protein PHLCEN_2v13657 [Hermanssonia centrifuga]
MKEEPPLGAKCKDKFLIQSTLITPEKETLPLQDIWSGEPSEEIHSQKIKVAYLPPEGQTVPEEDEHVQPSLFEPAADPSGIHGYETAPRGQNGYGAPPIPEFHDDNVQEHPSDRDIHVSAPSTPPPEVSREPSRRTHESPVEESPVANEAPAVVNVNVHHPSPPPPPPQPIPDPAAALQAKLNEANAEILRLRSLISSMPDLSTVQSATATSQATPTELRRRTRALSDDGSTLGPETEVGSYVEEGMMQPEGVPLQIVIVVALGVFITTYLFF